MTDLLPIGARVRVGEVDREDLLYRPARGKGGRIERYWSADDTYLVRLDDGVMVFAGRAELVPSGEPRGGG